MTKILFFQSDFLWYRKNLFEEIAKENDTTLTVCYGNIKIPSSSLDNSYKLIKALEFKTKYFWFLDYFTPFFKTKPDQVIVSQNPYIITTIPFIILCRLWKVKVLLRGHGGLKRKSLPEFMYRKIFYMLSDSFISYTKADATLISKMYSTSVIPANNTLVPSPPAASSDDLGLYTFLQTQYYVYIGSLEPYKRVVEMLNSFLQYSPVKMNLVVIGGGSLLPVLNDILCKSQNRNESSIYLMGQINDSPLLSYIISNSIGSICYGDLGLQVVHALALGTPTFAIKNNFNTISHSPEYRYISESKFGHFFESDSDLTDFLAKRYLDRQYSECDCTKAIEFYRQSLSMQSLAKSHILK